MAKIGYTKCGLCGNQEAAVSETATGTLSLTCHKCDLSSFAKAGTKAARTIRANLDPIDEPLEQPPKKPQTKPTAPTNKPAPAESPAPAKKINSVFNLGAL